MIQGEVDTVIPPSYVEQQAAQLPSAELVIVPATGHNAFASNDSCVGRIAIGFLNDPSSPLDTSCLDQMNYQFVLPVDMDAGTPVAQ